MLFQRVCSNFFFFLKLKVRYREKLPLVLKEVTFSIKDKEKIGIVGRTGAGKSSIGVALYRLINTENGIVRIAGHNINEIGWFVLLLFLISNLTFLQRIAIHSRLEAFFCMNVCGYRGKKPDLWYRNLSKLKLQISESVI